MSATTTALLLAASLALAGPAPAPPGAPPTPPAPAEPAGDRLAWWREARFGMFIHWGLYAIPAGRWNGEPVEGAGEWIMHTRGIPVGEYEPLAARFNPVEFDAREWVALAKRAGMKYIVITSKHHDGFCLFDSAHTDYDIVDATPFGRDVLGELAGECARQGVRLGFYYSILDWHHPDARGERFPAYRDHLHAQVRELLTNYGPVAVMWFDGEWIEEWTEEQGRELYALCRSLQPGIIVNNRVGKGRDGMAGLSTRPDAAGDFGTPEQEVPARGLPGVDWESCMTMNGTWGFKADDHGWKSSEMLIRTLADIASKGGNFLLNVGPTAEGRIPEPSVERLEAMGRWLEVNGEAIYGTRAGPFRRLAWGRCTAAPGRLYLHVFDWPADGALHVPGLVSPVRSARLLEGPAGLGGAAAPAPALRVDAASDGMVVRLPPAAPGAPASVVVLEVDADPEVIDLPIRARADGVIELRATDAVLHGRRVRLEHRHPQGNIGHWTDENESVSWEFESPGAGRYAVEMEVACPADTAGGEVRLTIGLESVRAAVPATGSWDDFRTVAAGSLALPGPGRYAAMLAATSKPHHAVANIAAVRLVPVGP